MTALTPSAKAPQFGPPEVTVAGCTCDPAGPGYELTLPSAPPAAPQLKVAVSVPRSAPAGETISFAATVAVASGSGSTLTATASAPLVTVATAAASSGPASSRKAGAASAGPTSSGPTSGGRTTDGRTSGGRPSGALASTGLASGGLASGGLAGTTPSGLGTGDGLAGAPSGAGAAAVPIGALPIVGSGGPGSTINVPAGSAANLFPQIDPAPAASQAPTTGRDAGPGQGAVTASATNPISLTGAQFGSQVIGLIVLLLGVAVVATGISVRKVRAVANPST
ncbi:MAG TPA: hypothetical protein VGD68_16845 [Streptosporangiaceae bacterium]